MATALHWAVRAQDTEGVRTLLAEGLDPNVTDTLERTPLFHAAIHRLGEVVDLLLAAGADPNAADVGGVTPLMAVFEWAVIFGVEMMTGPCYLPAKTDPQVYEIARRLAAHGADLDRADIAGRTALLYAAAKLDDRAVAMLLQLGADPKIRDENGHTANWIAYDAYSATWVTSGGNFEGPVNRIQRLVPSERRA